MIHIRQTSLTPIWRYDNASFFSGSGMMDLLCFFPHWGLKGFAFGCSELEQTRWNMAFLGKCQETGSAVNYCFLHGSGSPPPIGPANKKAITKARGAHREDRPRRHIVRRHRHRFGRVCCFLSRKAQSAAGTVGCCCCCCSRRKREDGLGRDGWLRCGWE